MTLDLFEASNELEPLKISDADLYILRYLPLNQPPQVILRTLIDTVPWRHENVVVWGRTFEQPRLIAWYGDEGQNYSYSGISLAPLPWTDLLLDIKSNVEGKIGTTFNSVLLNYYRNNNDSMGFHSDDECELGPFPTIASLSLGETRTLVLKHRAATMQKPVRLRLPSNSLLLMKGRTQKNWRHGIDKETKPCGPRVNLTFRQIKIF